MRPGSTIHRPSTLLSLLILFLPLARTEELPSNLQALDKALDPSVAISLDDTLDAIEGLQQATSDSAAKGKAVEALIKLIARQEPVKLSEGKSRVTPLMLLKSEAVRTLRKLKDPRAVSALRAFQTREHKERFFPMEAVEETIDELSAVADSQKATPPVAGPTGAWREPWQGTEEGRRFLQLADQMATASHGQASAARNALMHSGNPVVPFLVDCLHHHEHFVGRRSSAYLLGQINDPSTVPDLVKALKESDENVLWSIINSLGFMEDQRATESIVPLMDHALDRIRVAAAQALVRLRDLRSMEALMENIEKYKRGRSRARAAEALGEIGDRRAMPLLLKTMNDRHIVPREYAAMSYGELANDRELGALLKMGLSGKLQVREIQLAIEEHFQADLRFDPEDRLENQIEAIRKQFEALKAGEPVQLKPPPKPPVEQEMEVGPDE